MVVGMTAAPSGWPDNGHGHTARRGMRWLVVGAPLPVALARDDTDLRDGGAGGCGTRRWPAGGCRLRLGVEVGEG